MTIKEAKEWWCAMCGTKVITLKPISMEAPLLCPNPNCGWDLIRKRPMNPKGASGEWEVKK